MIKNIQISFDEKSVNIDDLLVLLNEQIIYDFFPEISDQIIEPGKITIRESYELGNIDDGLLEEQLEKLAQNYPNFILKISGEGDDAGSLWKFNAECVNGKFTISKSDYVNDFYNQN